MLDVDVRTNDGVDIVDDELNLKVFADHLHVEENGLLLAASFQQIRPKKFSVRTLNRSDGFAGVKLFELIKSDGRQRLCAEENQQEEQFHHQWIVENERNETVREALISGVKVRRRSAADRLDRRRADFRARGRLQNGVIQRQKRSKILLDQLNLIVDVQKLQFGQMFQIGDQIDDDRFLSIVEFVQTERE